jgi:hypothetical protein
MFFYQSYFHVKKSEDLKKIYDVKILTTFDSCKNETKKVEKIIINQHSC